VQLKVTRKIKCEGNAQKKVKEKIKGKGGKSNFQNLEGVVTAWLTTDLESVKRFRAVTYCVFSRFQCFVLRSLPSSILALCPQFYDTSCPASIQLLLPRWAKRFCAFCTLFSFPSLMVLWTCTRHVFINFLFFWKFLMGSYVPWTRSGTVAALDELK